MIQIAGTVERAGIYAQCKSFFGDFQTYVFRFVRLGARSGEIFSREEAAARVTPFTSSMS